MSLTLRIIFKRRYGTGHIGYGYKNQRKKHRINRMGKTKRKNKMKKILKEISKWNRVEKLKKHREN